MKGGGPPGSLLGPLFPSSLLPSLWGAPPLGMLSILLSREGRIWHHWGSLSDLLGEAQSGEPFTVPQRGPSPICLLITICIDNQCQIPLECRVLQKEPSLQQGEDAPASPSPPCRISGFPGAFYSCLKKQEEGGREANLSPRLMRFPPSESNFT